MFLIFLSAIFILFYIFPKIYIDYKQLGYVRQKLQSPAVILSKEDYQKAGEYTIAKLKFSIFSSLWETMVFFLWVAFGFLALQELLGPIHHHHIQYPLTYFVLFLLIYTILNLPLSYYQNMILDKHFGFNKSSKKLFWIDALKSLALMVFFAIFIGYGLVYFINHFTYWWIHAFALVSLLVIGINGFYPTLIAPLFNKFTPLQDTHLKNRIDKLLNHVGFKSSGVFVMDASKRDGRLNAYFGGISKSKRVILFDTLLNSVSDDGLLAILGHELGHFKHRDILRNLFISLLLIFALFVFMGIYSAKILHQLGTDANSGSIFALMLLLSPVLLFWAMPIIGYFSRCAEYAADEFGAELTSKTTLANALIRIVKENKAFPYSHPLYTYFHHTHPPLLDRLRALEHEI